MNRLSNLRHFLTEYANRELMLIFAYDYFEQGYQTLKADADLGSLSTRLISQAKKHDCIELISDFARQLNSVAFEQHQPIYIAETVIPVDDEPIFSQEPLAQQNRQMMLNLVENTWIKGGLEKVVKPENRIALRLIEKLGMVHQPWGTFAYLPEQQETVLPSEISLSTIFKESNFALLILGEPGSGKTVLLLQLCQALIMNARDDKEQPIPVVLKLNTWTPEFKCLADWLLTEFMRRYDVNENISNAWLADRSICFLFDGLDEVSDDYREMCVQAINKYRQEQSFLPIAICCRTAIYEVLDTRLHLQRAVEIQPLIAQQISTYFKSAIRKSQSFEESIAQDTALQSLVKTPLMLDIFTSVYKNRPVSDNRVLHDAEAYRTYLMEQYVDGAVAALSEGIGHSKHQVQCWLTSVAKIMSRQKLDAVFIDDIQVSWLANPDQGRQYYFSVRVIIAGIFLVSCTGGAVLGLIPILVDTPDPSLFSLGASFALANGLMAALSFIITGSLGKRLRHLWIVVFCLIAVFGVVGRSIGSEVLGPLPVFFTGLLYGLPGGLAGIHIAQQKRIDLNIAKRWNWPQALRGVLIGLVIGIGVGVLVSEHPIVSALQAGISTGLLFLIILGLQPVKTFNEDIYPGQRFVRSLLHAIRLACLLFLAIFTIIITLSTVFHELPPDYAVYLALLVATPISLVVGFVSGGIAVLQYLILRLILYRNIGLPWNLRAFLDQAAEHRLFNRVGGGYYFFHDWIQQYLAEPSKSAAQES